MPFCPDKKKCLDKNLSGQKLFGQKNCPDEKMAGQKKLSGQKNCPDKKKLSGRKNCPDKFFLSALAMPLVFFSVHLALDFSLD